MELVRAHLTGDFERRWDYRGRSARGCASFRVSGLQQDQEEDDFAKLDAHRPYSFHDMKSDLVLPNGAGFITTIPTPNIPPWNVARSKICWRTIGRGAYRCSGRPIAEINNSAAPVLQLYKNNTDFHGHSYGCRETTTSFHARCLFHNSSADCCRFWSAASCWPGAGKSEWKRRSRGMCPVPSSSQRADFMEAELGVDTMHNRPILNTRDEPHADRTAYRRLHLILGDANMC